MANWKNEWVSIDKEEMVSLFNYHGYSIRSIAKAVDRSERSIYLYLSKGSMPKYVYFMIRKVLNGQTNWDLIMPSVYKLFPDITAPEFARLINSAMWGDDRFVCARCKLFDRCLKRQDDACEEIVYEWLEEEVPDNAVPL